MDGLPGQVCEQCFTKLMSFRDFRDLCRKSDDYLKMCASKMSAANRCGVIDNDDEFCVEADPSFWFVGHFTFVKREWILLYILQVL